MSNADCVHEFDLLRRCTKCGLGGVQVAENDRGLFPGMFMGVRRLAWMDAADPEDTAGGCELCEVEWQGTFHEVQQQMIDHRHSFLREVRYELDVYPNSFGNQRFMVEQLWHLAAQIDGSGGDDAQS